MVATRKPGPFRIDPEGQLNDGTMIRQLSPRPGPAGADKGSFAGGHGKPSSALLKPRSHKKSLHAAIKVLRQGSRGREVEKLQRQLNARITPSPQLAIDGIFSPGTLQAVLKYQQGLSMTADGVVDKQTWYRLLRGDKVTVQQVSVPGGAPRGPSAVRQHAATAAAASAKGVWEWPLEDKFAEALRLTAPKLPGNMRYELEALLSPTNLGLMAGTLVIWAGSHAFGIGEVVDILLLVGGAAFLGMAVFDVAGELGNFLVETSGAAEEKGLDDAASHLARAIAIMGVVAFAALLVKVARGRGGKGGGAEAPPKQAPPVKKPPKVKPARPAQEPTPAPASASFLKPRLPKTVLEPGATPGPVSPTLNEMPEIPARFPKISQSDVNTFASTPTPEILPEGTKLYRVVGDGSNPAGAFWTRELPATEAEWRSAAAVQGQWNGDGGYVEYTVPPGGMPAWTGQAAPQPAALPGYILKGGGDQVVIPANTITPCAPKPTPWSTR